MKHLWIRVEDIEPQEIKRWPVLAVDLLIVAALFGLAILIAAEIVAQLAR